MPVYPGRVRQEDFEFEASLDYTRRLFNNKKPGAMIK
jgi:hypothetical protein